MDDKPFSARISSEESTTSSSEVTKIKPPSISVGSNPTQSIHPPTTDYNTTTPTITTVNPAAQTILITQNEKSNTVANVFMIIGAVVLVIGLALMGLGGISFPETSVVGDEKVAKIQPIIDRTIVFSSDGNTTNESFEFNTDDWYHIRAAQGVTINSISILDENNNTLFFEEKCKDFFLEDGIDDCEDYSTYEIGNIDWYRYNRGTDETGQSIYGTININATGEININNLDDEFWEEINQISIDIDTEYYGGPGAMLFFGACATCCMGPVVLLVGVIIRFA